MDSIFISSVQRDFGDIRQSARRAVESLGLRPLMAEGAGASAASPQRALLDLVERADVFLLIVGPRYSKPTEDEFNEARRLAKPVLVLRQAVECEPEQEEFAERVAGGWRGGRLWGSFNDASDVGYAVVRALSNLRSETASADLRPRAQEHARELAVANQNRSFVGSSVARIVYVPLVGDPLLGAVALGRAGLGDDVAALARTHRLVPQTVGIEARVSRTGIALHQVGGYGNAEPLVEVDTSSSITATFEVGGTDQFGGMRIDPTRLRDAIETSGSFAQALWEVVDEREAVQQVAVALAIPEAQHKVFGAATGRNSIQMGSFGMPTTVVVPEPARIVRRAEVGAHELEELLIAEAHRVFADAGAVEP